MRQISSRHTWFLKRVFPWIMFGIILGSCVLLLTLYLRGVLPLAGLLVTLPGNAIALGVMWFIAQKMLWPLADCVSIDDGRDELVVMKQGWEVRVPSTALNHASSSRLTNPEIVTLTLREPTEFGSVIKFAAPQRMVRFTENPIVTELNERARGELAN